MLSGVGVRTRQALLNTKTWPWVHLLPKPRPSDSPRLDSCHGEDPVCSTSEKAQDLNLWESFLNLGEKLVLVAHTV